MKLAPFYVAIANLFLVTATSAALGNKSATEILTHRSNDGYLFADVLRFAEARRSPKFKIQGVSNLDFDKDGKQRVAICYWLGDVKRIENNATCGIRFLTMPGSGKYEPDVYTRDLSEGLLAGKVSFFAALEANFNAVCGAEPSRKDREC